MALCRPVLALFAALLLSGKAAASGEHTYTDTKRRFSLELPSGWRLHPAPGDVSGMTFRRDVDGAFALLRVSVRSAELGETAERALVKATRPFEGEIGFRGGAERPASVGLLPARRASMTVHASGDARTVRAVELFALVAFGHVHVLHFEHLDQERGRFSRDLDRLTGSYEALAGRRRHAPLVGTWHNEKGAPELMLSEDDRFRLGGLVGSWSADGGQLVLNVTEGQERYRYRLEGRRLTLTSPNLDAPLTYIRSGSARFSAEPAKKARRRPLAGENLIGRWRALDSPATEPLVLVLAPAGSVSFGPLSGSWRFRKGRLTILSTAGARVTYTASLDGDRLVLDGGDLEKELLLERE